MNEVNPKAGTLKQNKINWSNLKHASRKLIALVMMWTVIAMTPGVVNAGTKNGDTCCTPAETTRLVKLVKAVKLTLPSRELVRKADTEAHRNLVRSLSENKVKKYSAMFASSDEAINSSFKNETMVSYVADRNTDETVNNLFQAENIDMSSSVVNSDTDIMDVFQAENDGIKMNTQAVAADDQITSNFMAENINTPGADAISKADAEMQQNLEKDNTIRYAKK